MGPEESDDQGGCLVFQKKGAEMQHLIPNSIVFLGTWSAIPGNIQNDKRAAVRDPSSWFVISRSNPGSQGMPRTIRSIRLESTDP